MDPRIKQCIFREYESLKKDPETGWSVEPYYPNEFGRWRLYMKGPNETPYERGVFQLSMTFPVEFPFVPPKIRFDTKIFHPNVDLDGSISMHLSASSAVTPIRSTLQQIMLLMKNPEDESFVFLEAGHLFQKNFAEFRKKAAEWTRTYATEDEIMSNGSMSPTPSEMVSSVNSSPRSTRARSPVEPLWTVKIRSNGVQANDVLNQPLSRSDQLVIERAYRNGLSLVELDDKLLHLGFGQAVDDNNEYMVRRSVTSTKRPYRRRKYFTKCHDGDQIIDDFIEIAVFSCERPTVDTVAHGILLEATILKKVTEAEELIKLLRQLDDTQQDLLALRCIHLYTRNSFLSSSLNRFLSTRDSSKIETLGPFCKLLLDAFTAHKTSTNSLLVYRGERLRSADLRAYKRAVGKDMICKWAGFISATKSECVALVRIRNALLVIRLEKKYNDGRAIDIKHLSQFDEEEEVLIRPGVEFSISRFECDERGQYKFFLTAYV